MGREEQELSGPHNPVALALDVKVGPRMVVGLV